jgi:hypothetical protein
MRVGALAIGVTSAMLLAGAALADTAILARADAWTAFGGTAQDGARVCGMSRSADDRYFAVKLFSGGDSFTVQMMGSSYVRVADRTGLKVVMTIDRNPGWIASATGFQASDGDAGFEFDLGKGEAARFMTEFRAGSRLAVSVHGSPDWTLSLAGASQVSDAFLACTRGIWR